MRFWDIFASTTKSVSAVLLTGRDIGSLTQLKKNVEEKWQEID
jgi:hypothetical protein